MPAGSAWCSDAAREKGVARSGPSPTVVAAPGPGGGEKADPPREVGPVLTEDGGRRLLVPESWALWAT